MLATSIAATHIHDPRFLEGRNFVTSTVRSGLARLAQVPMGGGAHRRAARWAREASSILSQGRCFPERDVPAGAFLLENAAITIASEVLEASASLPEPRRSSLEEAVRGGGVDLFADLIRCRMLRVRTGPVLMVEDALSRGYFPLPSASLWNGADNPVDQV